MVCFLFSATVMWNCFAGKTCQVSMGKKEILLLTHFHLLLSYGPEDDGRRSGAC